MKNLGKYIAMRFIFSGDWHLTGKAPARRIDDYFQSQFDKVRFIIDKAEELDTDAIIQPGDLYDNAWVSYKVMGALAQEIKRYSGTFVSIEGQHDLRYHNIDNKNTPFHALEFAKCIRRPPIFYKSGVRIYRASWGEEIPKAEPGYFNILVTHRMVLKDEDALLFPGQTDFSTPSQLFGCNFNVVVSGDNHQSFIVSSRQKQKFLFNCGCLLRSNTTLKEHQPIIVFFDTDAPDSFQIINVPVKPFSDVMDLNKVEEEQRQKEVRNEFIEQLSADVATDLNFRSAVTNLMDELKPSQAVRTIIDDVLEK